MLQVTKSRKSNSRIGSDFDAFLKTEGLFEDSEAVAIKRVIAYRLQQELEKQHLSKSNLATKMQTSRSSLNRLLDPENTAVTLHTIVRAAHALGIKFKLSFA